MSFASSHRNNLKINAKKTDKTFRFLKAIAIRKISGIKFELFSWKFFEW